MEHRGNRGGSDWDADFESWEQPDKFCDGCGTQLEWVVYHDGSKIATADCPHSHKKELGELPEDEYSDPPTLRCRVCWHEFQHKNIHEHHVSYETGRTIPVCVDCHAKIHTHGDFRRDLTPEHTRQEAEENGWL